MTEWAIDQTMAVLGWVLAEVRRACRFKRPKTLFAFFDALDRDEPVAEVAELLIGFVRLTHAARGDGRAVRAPRGGH